MYITYLCNYIYVLKESGEKWSEKLEKKWGANDFKGFRHFGGTLFWDLGFCSLLTLAHFWHLD